jgi:hypothetical protein
MCFQPGKTVSQDIGSDPLAALQQFAKAGAPLSMMSRTIRSVQRSPKISRETFKGQSDRRLISVLRRITVCNQIACISQLNMRSLLKDK